MSELEFGGLPWGRTSKKDSSGSPDCAPTPESTRDLPALAALRSLPDMDAITLTVEPCPETGGYVARWDDPSGQGGITTQGDSIRELELMVADAVNAYFDPGLAPTQVRLHFVEDPILVLT
jgi:predicted RNase H-like HicB family nuclease